MSSVATENGSIRSRLVWGSIWNLVAVASNQGAALIASVLLARLLGKSVFGQYAIVQSTLVTGVALVQLAIGYTAMKYVAEHRSTDRERTNRILGLCLAVSLPVACLGTLLLFASAPWLASHVLGGAALSTPLKIGSLFLLFSAVTGCETGVMAGLEDYRGLAISGLIGALSTILSVVFFAYSFGLHGALWGLTVGAATRCAVHAVFMANGLRKHNLRFHFSGLGQEVGVISKFALPCMLSGYIYVPAVWLGNAILVNRPQGYDEMAVYGAATSVRLLVLFIPGVIGTVSLSVLNNEKGAADPRRYRRTLSRSIMFIGGSALATAMVAALFGNSLLQLFGKEFRGNLLVLWVLLASTIAEALSVALYQHFQAHAKMWTSLFAVVIPRDTAFAVLALLLIGPHGVLGLAIAYTATRCLTFFTLLAWLLAEGYMGTPQDNMIAGGLSHSRPHRTSDLQTPKTVCSR